MEGSALIRYATGPLPLAVFSTLLIGALLMMNAATQNSALFGDLYSLLLVVNILGIVLLLALILINLYRLVLQYRARTMGSRLTLRLLAMLVLVAVVPVTVVFAFSIQALNRGVDSWFDVKIEQAMDDALNLGRTALDAMKKDVADAAQEMAEELEDTSDKLALSVLNYLREAYEVSELTLFSQDGRIIAASSAEGPELESLVPSRPSEAILSQVRQGQPYANLDPVGGSELRLRVVVPVYSKEVGAPLRLLQVLQPLPARYSRLAESVQSAFAEYEKLVYLRGPLKFGFTLSLSLVALLTMLIAISGAIFGARRLVAPVRDLAEGTEAVARGDYKKQLPVASQDEFGILVESFNDMTRQIHRAQSELRRSQFETEMQRTYLETVLAHLSSGVLSFDRDLRLRTFNAAAEHILGVDLESAGKKPLSWLEQAHDRLAPLVGTIAEHSREAATEWQAQTALEGRNGHRVLILRGTRMPAVGARGGGHVIVFDDVTALIQAQRDAAWGEVARRLAHEIKNPLTPIQLSAERIRHKCMTQLPDRERHMLERATGTIVDQVEALKAMVDAFSEYARPVQMQPQPLDLNRLIRDVAELYRSGGLNQAMTDKKSKITRAEIRAPVHISLKLERGLPQVVADGVRLRQVLHNLLLNAQDALANTREPRITLRTARRREGEHETVELEIRDNGPGFPEELLDRVFEPYVTNKDKGTGLGLAIVKKIVEEHGGTLRAENLEGGGARVVLRLPLRAADDMEPAGATLSSKAAS